MGVYAILDEYDADVAGIHVQAAIIVNRERDLPVIAKAYRSNYPKEVIHKEIYDFLEKNIGRDCTVYVCDEYYSKFSKVLNNLKHRFTTANIRNFPESRRDKLCGYLNKMAAKATCEAQVCLEQIISKTNK